jgi:hypothetical protein
MILVEKKLRSRPKELKEEEFSGLEILDFRII